MERINELLTQINDFVWGAPLIILLLGTGIYFTWRLKLLQLTASPSLRSRSSSAKKKR